MFQWLFGKSEKNDEKKETQSNFRQGAQKKPRPGISHATPVPASSHYSSHGYSASYPASAPAGGIFTLAPALSPEGKQAIPKALNPDDELPRLRSVLDTLVENVELGSLFQHLSSAYAQPPADYSVRANLPLQGHGEQLNLRRHQIQPSEGFTVAQHLRYDQHITEMFLNYNRMSTLGVVSMASMLCYNTTLTVLDLSFSRPTLMGYYALCVALSSNNTLAQLHLMDAGVSDDEMPYFRDMLLANSALETLNFKANGITVNGLNSLLQALDGGRCHLTALDLSCNTLGRESEPQLMQMVANNTRLQIMGLRGVAAYNQGGIYVTEISTWCIQHVNESLRKNFMAVPVYNAMRMAVFLQWHRANRGHYFVDSITPLIPLVMRFTGYSESAFRQVHGMEKELNLSFLSTLPYFTETVADVSAMRSVVRNDGAMDDHASFALALRLAEEQQRVGKSVVPPSSSLAPARARPKGRGGSSSSSAGRGTHTAHGAGSGGPSSRRKPTSPSAAPPGGLDPAGAGADDDDVNEDDVKHAMTVGLDPPAGAIDEDMAMAVAMSLSLTASAPAASLVPPSSSSLTSASTLQTLGSVNHFEANNC